MVYKDALDFAAAMALGALVGAGLTLALRRMRAGVARG
jgi:hypothetical protein